MFGEREPQSSAMHPEAGKSQVFTLLGLIGVTYLAFAALAYSYGLQSQPKEMPTFDSTPKAEAPPAPTE
jgi:hypothetical protein